MQVSSQSKQSSNITVNTILRLRPLELKHKLKEDYFTISRGSNKSQYEEEKNSQLSSACDTITIHDPLKRSKDQYDFKFDKILTQENSNSERIEKALIQGENQLILSFGHKDSGKSYTIMGENNYQLENNLSDVDISTSDDSRGLILRYAHEVMKKDRGAKLSISFVDVVMDNVRDLLKYIKKDQKKGGNTQHLGSQLGAFDEQQTRFTSNYNEKSEVNLSQTQNIEKDFLEIHEKPGAKGSLYYLKNLTTIENIKELSDIAYFIDKGSQLSEQLNKKLNYTPGLRAIQIFQITVQSSRSNKDFQLIFIDLPDYEKLQTNIIDNQKLYESIVINNTFNTVAMIVGGLNNKLFNAENAPFENSKVTRIIQSFLQQSPPYNGLNLNFYCCIWPTESRYQEAINTLKFLDKIAKQDHFMGKSAYQGEMSTNQEKIMQEISKENVEIKFKIDSFKREHANKLQELRGKLGLEIPIDNILKSKGNQRELQVIKEHKEAIDKTDQFSKQNKEIEKKLEQIQLQIQDNDLARREIQENFSQKYYIIHKKIDKLREEYKQSEMELDNTSRGQINDRNEELQKILNNTHAMLIENAGLVDQLNETVVKKTQGNNSASGEMHSKRINFMKDEGKRDAELNYQSLLHKQQKEFETQLKNTQETQEYLLKKKEGEIQKSASDFKAFHDKIKQKLIYQNGVYSQTAKRIVFSQDQKPALPDQMKFKFLFSALEKQSQRGAGSMAQTFITGVGQIQGNTIENDHLTDFYNKKVDNIVNPDELRKYVKELMGELNKHSSSHPQILKGENVEQILKETEIHKKEFEKANKKSNDVKIQIEAQKRLIERIQLEKIIVPGQPNLFR
eukprot:403354110